METMFNKILLTTDGSEHAEKAAATAIELAKVCKAELRCVSVIEAPVLFGAPGASVAANAEFYETLEKELTDLATAAAERMVSRASEEGLEASSVVHRGIVVDEIVAEAESWDADIIVVATHGRTGLSRLVLGSVANKIVNHASCPVLLHRVSEEGETDDQ